MTDNDPLIALIVLVFFYFALEYFHGPLTWRSKPDALCNNCHPRGLSSGEDGECPECGADTGLERLMIHNVFCMRMGCNHGSAPDAAEVLHWEYLKSIYGSRWGLGDQQWGTGPEADPMALDA